jgi:hypothetical protein
MKGPISSLTVIGTPIILINDKQCAVDILDKESAKTSSRPESTFAYELYFPPFVVIFAAKYHRMLT